MVRETSRKRAKVTPKVARDRAKVAPHERPMWVCPRCNKWFVNKNNWHSCSHWPLDHHLKNDRKLHALWDAFLAAVREIGPVRVVSNKTRLGVMVRVRFAGVAPRKGWLRAGMWLTRRVRSKRFVKVENVAPRCWIHWFDLCEPDDIDSEIRKYLREAYAIGRQEHLIDRGDSPRAGAGSRSRSRKQVAPRRP